MRLPSRVLVRVLNLATIIHHVRVISVAAILRFSSSYFASFALMSKSLHLQSASDSFLQRIMQVRHIPTYYIIISTYRTRKVYPVFLLSSFFPVYLLLSSRVNLSSVMFQETVDRIRERVLPMWPDGVEFQVYRDETSEYLVKFSGNPWTARSSLGVMAMKLILELFAVLARQGYTCASSIDTGGAVCETCYMQRLVL